MVVFRQAHIEMSRMMDSLDLKQNKLVIVVALAPEAKAIRREGQWRRVEQTSGAPMCYQREDKPMIMIVTGAGKIASALGTAWILDKHVAQHCHPVIMNVGVAGAAQAEMGSLWWVHKVTDAGSQKSWYPQQPTKHTIPGASLMTFDSVQTAYPGEVLVDMEASGFMQAACRWATIERIAVIKCISDNNEQSSEGLKPKDVVILLDHHRADLEALFDESMQLAHKGMRLTLETLQFDSWHQRWHFTQTQKIQLKKHLAALALFMPGEEAIFFEACSACRSAKEVLACLAAIHEETHGQLFHV